MTVNSEFFLAESKRLAGELAESKARSDDFETSLGLEQSKLEELRQVLEAKRTKSAEVEGFFEAEKVRSATAEKALEEEKARSARAIEDYKKSGEYLAEMKKAQSEGARQGFRALMLRRPDWDVYGELRRPPPSGTSTSRVPSSVQDPPPPPSAS